MTRDRVRWGVISTANIGRAAMIPALQAAGNGELVAVASRSLERAQEFAAKLGIPRAYGSYEDLLADPSIDAVYNPLPNSLHLEWSTAAMAAGKHVLCEKPLALNAAEAQAMVEAAARHGVLLTESFMYRYHPQTARVLALVAEGAIGALRLVHAAFTFRVTNPANVRLQPELGGGALMDVGCYCVNVGRTLASAAGAGEPVEAQAYATWTESSVDGELAGSLRWAGGLLVQFDCALTLPRREYYEAVGSEGVISVPVAFLPGSGATTISVRRGRESAQTETIPGLDEYRAIAEHFAGAILHGTPLAYPPEEAVANMRAIDALYRSARNAGRPEPV
jgi:D-xylose 1-dehydrogenase (NADP+, D-xylono-1,5-lactone-forming)